jgi:hypothetical protein
MFLKSVAGVSFVVEERFNSGAQNIRDLADQCTNT